MARFSSKIAKTSSLEDHIKEMRKRVRNGVVDPHVHRLARNIAAGTWEWQPTRDGRGRIACVPFKDRWHPVAAPGQQPPRCGAREDACVVARIWDFTVLNVRYTSDPRAFDTYVDIGTTLAAGGGDCFPVETLVLHEGGHMGPIGDVVVGDRIHDGERFVDVLKTWDRGLKTIYGVQLNNNSTLRLSDHHKVLRVPRKDYVNPHTGAVARNVSSGGYDDAQETRLAEIAIGDDLLQPRYFAYGTKALSAEDAFLVGLYLAEGCKTRKKPTEAFGTWLSLAGIANSKGGREELMAILDGRGVTYQTRERDIAVKTQQIPVLAELDLGRTAIDKHLPHLDWDEATVANIVRGLELDGGFATNGSTFVFSSVSYELALQYRVLKRMQGYSTSLTRVDKHGGAGSNPIYRVTVRKDHVQRPWARVRGIAVEEVEQPCVDIMTSSGRVYLPENDIIVRQCDDSTIFVCTLAESLGYESIARVISQDGQYWAHVYPCIRVGNRWVPLDTTEHNKQLGWEFPRPAARKDFDMGV